MSQGEEEKPLEMFCYSLYPPWILARKAAIALPISVGESS